MPDILGQSAIRGCKLLLEALEGTEKTREAGRGDVVAFMRTLVRHRPDPNQDIQDLASMVKMARVLAHGLYLDGGKAVTLG